MKSYHRIKAVKVSNDILDFLSTQTKPVTSSEIARALDIPEGTILCHLATHEDSNFIENTGKGYEIGHALALIWARYKTNLKNKIENLDQKNTELEA